MNINPLNEMIMWVCVIGIFSLIYVEVTVKDVSFTGYAALLFIIELISISPIAFKKKVT